MKEFEKTRDRYGRKSANFSGHDYTNAGWKGQFIKIGGKSGKMQNSERGLPILSG